MGFLCPTKHERFIYRNERLGVLKWLKLSIFRNVLFVQFYGYSLLVNLNKKIIVVFIELLWESQFRWILLFIVAEELVAVELIWHRLRH